MPAPKVSVIVPNYNHARFLRQRLDSILRQTFQDFELLLLDDGSTDDSREVLQEFAGDSRTRLFLNEHNSGSTFKQWNRAVREARGEYLWFAESDDAAAPPLLEALVRCLDDHSSCGLAYCQSHAIDEAGVVQGTFLTHTGDLDPIRWLTDFVASGPAECARYLLFKNTIPNASAVLIRRDTYERLGGADETMKLCGDWLLWAKILSGADIAYVAEPLNYFRQHRSTVSAKRMRTLLFVWERYGVTEQILRHCPVREDAREDCLQLLADLWETYSAEDPHARSWHWRLYRRALRIDPGITRRLFKKTIQPWMGGVKNRLKRFFLTKALL